MLYNYLEALHEKDVANRDHTTLLLNCYTKLKNVAKLEQFVMGEGKLNFDVETAIKIGNRLDHEILVPDWLINSHVISITSSDWLFTCIARFLLTITPSPRLT
eukprot:sb/3478214/